MNKNVNNDVSKDPPIGRAGLLGLCVLGELHEVETTTCCSVGGRSYMATKSLVVFLTIF